MQTNTTTSLEFIEIGFAADETGVFLPDVTGDFERAVRYCSSAKELARESLKAVEQLHDLAIIHLLTTGSWPIFRCTGGSVRGEIQRVVSGRDRHSG
jgi:hypothetical protein